MTSSKNFTQQISPDDPETELDDNSEESISGADDQESFDEDDDFDVPLDDIDTFDDPILDDDDDDDDY
jgi:hypothetical protein